MIVVRVNALKFADGHPRRREERRFRRFCATVPTSLHSIAACAAIEVLVVLPHTIARGSYLCWPRACGYPGAECAPALRRAAVVDLRRHRDTSLFVLFFRRHSPSVQIPDLMLSGAQGIIYLA